MRTHLRRLIAAPSLAAIFAAFLFPTIAAAGPASITFGYEDQGGLVPGGSCIYGRASANAQVALTWKSKANALKAQATVQSSSGGSFSYCSATATLKTGDKLKANDGSSQRTFTMPNVTLTVDRAANEFRGLAPANSNLLLWHHSGFSDFYAREDVVADSTGHWAFTDVEDVPAATDAYIDWLGPNGDFVTVNRTAPELDVTIGSADISGIAAFNSTVKFNLYDGATLKGTATVSTDEYGQFSGSFVDAGSSPVNVAVGDRVVNHKVAMDLDWIVPDSSATGNAATEKVHGSCQDAGNLSESAIIRVFRANQQRGFAIVGVDAAGNWHVNFNKPDGFLFNGTKLSHGDRISVECSLDTGDTVTQSFIVP
jgi:hypothetical protein